MAGAPKERSSVSPPLDSPFSHQVASVSSLPLLFFTQLCESLCVPDGGEHLRTGYWQDLSLSYSFLSLILLVTSVYFLPLLFPV